MLDMTIYDDEQSSYIIDVKINDKGLIELTFADGKTREEPYSEHNYSMYRDRMVEQAKKYADGAIVDLGYGWIKTQLLRWGALIGGIVGMFLLYNVDVHVIMRIVITLLAVIGEAAVFLATQFYLALLENESIEAFAYQEYIKHLEDFRYYDEEKGVHHYIFPIEDIATHQLDVSFVQDTSAKIKEMESMGSKKKDIRINYKKMGDNNLKK